MALLFGCNRKKCLKAESLYDYVMIICGKFSAGQLLKILGIVQVVIALVVTSIGIALTVKFANVHHENGTEYEHAIAYVDNPWTTKYGAGIWMGLVMLVAGMFSSYADIKPGKSKYAYTSIFLNIAVTILSVVLLVLCADAISWYKSCKYTYYQSNANIATNDCSSSDKNTGKNLYTGLLVCCVVALPITIVIVVLAILNNKVLFEDWCTGWCFRSMVYKAKGGPKVAFKTKNTHEFNQESSGPQPFTHSVNVYV